MNLNYATHFADGRHFVRTVTTLALLLASASGVLGQFQKPLPPPPPPQRAAREGTTRPRRASPAPASTNAPTNSHATVERSDSPQQRDSNSSTAAPPPDDDEEIVTVETDLVSVPVVVTNASGAPLVGIGRERFRIYEDNRAQQLASFARADAPFEVALLLDTSGSTRTEITLIRRAANLFIESLRPGDRVAIVGFTTVEEEGERLARVEVRQELTDDRRRLRDAIGSIGASNGTPFYDALERIATEVFDREPAPELRGRRAIVSLTDGVDSTSDAEYAEARARLLPRGVVSYFVQINTESYVETRLLQDCAESGRLQLSRVQLERYRRLFAPFLDREDVANFCRLGSFQRMQISRQLYDLARREMEDLARLTGGKVFPTIDLRDARRAFAEVAAEIGTLYSIGYYSSNKTRDGKFRKIRVEVTGAPGAQVRAREGYNAPGSSSTKPASE